MENLIFSLNATIPVFLMMIAGMLFKKMGIFTEEVTVKMNQFVFTVALPVLLFQDISGADFYDVWDTRYVIFCFCVTLLCILAVFALSFLLKNRTVQGEFVQASYRSSAAILGIAFVQNIYGSSGMAPLMIIGTVPLYNIMAVIILSLLKPDRERLNAALIRKTVKGILTNPILLGIAAGLIWSLSGLPQPVIMQKTVKNLAVLATPLGLMAMGASFDFKAAFQSLKLASVCCFLKLIGFCAVFLPIAALLGFRTEKLVAILVMLGSATTVSSFVMAKNMGHEGTLSASAVMLSTLLSAFTLTAWLYVLKTLHLF